MPLRIMSQYQEQELDKMIDRKARDGTHKHANGRHATRGHDAQLCVRSCRRQRTGTAGTAIDFQRHRSDRHAAQRRGGRKEEVQDAPLAVAAVSQEALVAVGAPLLRELTNIVPGFNGRRNPNRVGTLSAESLCGPPSRF